MGGGARNKIVHCQQQQVKDYRRELYNSNTERMYSRTEGAFNKCKWPYVTTSGKCPQREETWGGMQTMENNSLHYRTSGQEPR